MASTQRQQQQQQKKAAVVVASKNAQKPASTDVARFFLLFHNWPDTGLLAPDKYV